MSSSPWNPAAASTTNTTFPRTILRACTGTTPHHHGIVADQIFAGLFGAIIIEDPEPIEASVDRVMVVSDTTLDGSGNILAVPAMERMMGREGELLLLNGQSNPQFSARPGQRERWRIVNACVARYLRLRLDGQQLQLLGMDSGRFQKPEKWRNYCSRRETGQTSS
jgi:FtsP/CotA-like multicopper oxidase with cupredoxin domain